MLLRVENLGPVREAELDLGKPLIVLTGPNNSGKTYLAWAAYSLARLDPRRVTPPPSVQAWVDRLIAADGQRLGLDTLLAVREDVLRAIAEAARDRLPRDFASVRSRFDATRLELSSSSVDEGNLPAPGVRGFSTGPHLLAFIVGTNDLHLDVLDRQSDAADKSIPIQRLQTDELATAKRGVASLAIALIMSAFLRERWTVLPVERLAINLFAHELAAKRTELVDELLIDASDAATPTALRDKLQQRASQYPLVIRDALQGAILISAKANLGPLADLADDLEARVLDGKIEIDAYDNLRFIPNQDPNARLGLHESASVVKSLVSLVLYLRYEAQPGQRLVIDEPELNLHPDNQRRITRILAKAVNRGLKIMMSTHSDYVIRELNNLIMLGQDLEASQEVMRELGYDREEALIRDTVAAYMVNAGICKPLEMTETGFESETIENEIHKLNHESQTIYFRLFADD